jgi:ferritin
MGENETLKTKFHALAQEQIFNEFTAAQQYMAIGIYFAGAELPQLAKHFYSQAVEERNDRDVEVEIPGVGAVRNQFDKPRDALATRVTSSASSSSSGSCRSRSKRSR